MTLEFREGMPGEAAALTALARASKASWGYPAAWQEAWASILEITPDYLRREVVRVAVQDGAPVGFYALLRRPDGWQLDHFWIHPGHQGRGVGRAMFEHMAGFARAAAPCVVVIESDPHAASFYAHMGARHTGYVPAPMEGDPSRRLPVLTLVVASPA